MGLEELRRVVHDDRSPGEVGRVGSHGEAKAKEDVGNETELHLDDVEVDTF